MCYIYVLYGISIFIHPYIHPLIQICEGVYFIVSGRHSTLPQMVWA